MDGNVKFRSVCEGCTTAKVRCNGKTPCERCLKKGVECVYLPFKNRGGHNHAHKSRAPANANRKETVTNSSLTSDVMGDIILDEHERRTWSVFFTLYKSFGKGCSQFWFKAQLFRMLKFLETRAAEDATAANASARLTSWMTALGIDVKSPPLCVKNPPSFLKNHDFTSKRPAFQSTLDDLRSDAAKRNLPWLNIGRDGHVEVNDTFTELFGVTQFELEQSLKDSNGGILPWGGDIMARIVGREADLILYLQGVSSNLDAVGKPSTIPCTIMIPSMNILHVLRAIPNGADVERREVLCVVRAVQTLHVDEHTHEYSSTIVFEAPDENAHVPTKARAFEEATTEAPSEYELTKRKMFELDEIQAVDDLIPLPDDILDENDDNLWLDNLLTWAADDEHNKALGSLPISDEMYNMHLAEPSLHVGH